jgi:hypothetical protein
VGIVNAARDKAVAVSVIQHAARYSEALELNSTGLVVFPAPTVTIGV